MPTLIASITGLDKQMNDQTIANDMLMGAKGAASAYLTATLECATPELRSMYEKNLQQVVSGHAAMTALAVTKDWYNPYDNPHHQLADTLRQSVEVVKLQHG